MAVKTLVRTTCDRCEKLIEEVPNASTGETRTGKPLVYVEARDIDPIRFDDLCARCLPRTVSLLPARLRTPARASCDLAPWDHQVSAG